MSVILLTFGDNSLHTDQTAQHVSRERARGHVLRAKAGSQRRQLTVSRERGGAHLPSNPT